MEKQCGCFCKPCTCGNSFLSSQSTVPSNLMWFSLGDLRACQQQLLPNPTDPFWVCGPHLLGRLPLLFSLGEDAGWETAVPWNSMRLALGNVRTSQGAFETQRHSNPAQEALHWCFLLGFWCLGSNPPLKGGSSLQMKRLIIHASSLRSWSVYFIHLSICIVKTNGLVNPLHANCCLHRRHMSHKKWGGRPSCVQIIPVDRVSAASRHHAAGNIRRRAIDNRWPHVILFPEGTTTNGKALISFKTGAFSPGLPVQPMVIKYPHKYVNPCWCDQGGPLVVLLQLMTQFVNYMEVSHLFLLLQFHMTNV